MVSEQELEKFIINAGKQDIEKLHERGFPLPGSPTLYNQVRLGDYGIVDIIAIGRNDETDQLEIYLYELKRDTVSATDIPQITKYLGGIDSWLRNAKSINEEYSLKGFLMAPNVDEFLTRYVQPYIYFFSIKYAPYDGIHFNSHTYNQYDGKQCKKVDIRIPDKHIDVSSP